MRKRSWLSAGLAAGMMLGGAALGVSALEPQAQVGQTMPAPLTNSLTSGNKPADPVHWPIPEPATMALLGVGAALILIGRKRRRS